MDIHPHSKASWMNQDNIYLVGNVNYNQLVRVYKFYNVSSNHYFA